MADITVRNLSLAAIGVYRTILGENAQAAIALGGAPPFPNVPANAVIAALVNRQDNLTDLLNGTAICALQLSFSNYFGIYAAIFDAQPGPLQVPKGCTLPYVDSLLAVSSSIRVLPPSIVVAICAILLPEIF